MKKGDTRYDIFVTIGFDNSLGFKRNVAGIDRDHTFCASTSSKERQNSCSASNIQNDRILEERGTCHDKRRVGRGPNSVLDHHRVDV